MKGYYVIPTNGDVIEFIGKGCKSRALKIAKDLYANGDSEVFVQRFDDDCLGGYFADQETIYISNLVS